MSYYYVATPYTRYPAGTEAAFVLACQVTGNLLRAGVPAFSPIAHSHPIALHAGIDPLDHDTWMRADRPMMEAARGMLVVLAPGHDQSRGMDEEIRTFTLAGKPVLRLPCNPATGAVLFDPRAL